MRNRVIQRCIVICALGVRSLIAAESVAPGGTLYITGCVNPPQSAVLVHFESTASQPSGGHALTQHNQYGTPPRGAFGAPGAPGGTYWADAYTGISGCTAPIPWQAPTFAGFYDITAYSNYGSDYVSVIALINEEIGQPLIEMLSGTDYTLVGATPPHPQNHFGTASAIAVLQTILREFRQQTGVVATVNDISLVWGGKFDFYKPNSQYGCWWDPHDQCPHGEHRQGRNADIPFTGLGAQQAKFYDIAMQYGGASGGPILNEGNHYHLRFQY